MRKTVQCFSCKKESDCSIGFPEDWVFLIKEKDCYRKFKSKNYKPNEAINIFMCCDICFLIKDIIE